MSLQFLLEQQQSTNIKEHKVAQRVATCCSDCRGWKQQVCRGYSDGHVQCSSSHMWRGHEGKAAGSNPADV